MTILICACLAGLAGAQAQVQVTSVYSIDYRSAAGVPEVGDPWFGVAANFNIIGLPTGPYTVTTTYANQTVTYQNVSLGPGIGYYWWIPFDASVEGPIPASFTIANQDGTATMTKFLAVTYPAHAIEFMDAKLMQATQNVVNLFQPNSGTITTMTMLFGEPQITSSQGPTASYVPPATATQIVSQPLGIAAQQLVWNNLNTAVTNTFTAGESFSTTLRDSRVNPAIMRTVPWSALSSQIPSTVETWRQSELMCPTAAPEIADLVSKALPTNYQQTMTPWDAAQGVFLQTVRSLTYSTANPTVPLYDYDIGQGQCGDYSWLFVASMRKIGFAARVVCGWRTGLTVPHVWAEFYMPGVGWVPADPTDSWQFDSTGTFAYHFGTVPDLNTRTCVSMGGNFTWSLPDVNVTFLQVPWWYWWGSGSEISSTTTMSLLTPTSMVIEPSMPTVSENNRMYGRIELQTADPSEDTVVQLSSSSSAVQVPASVTIPAGWTSQAFPIVAGSVTADSPVTLTATSDSNSATSQITVKKRTVTVSLNAKWLVPTANPTATFTLNEPTASPTAISVTSTIPNWAPTTVVVPPGSRTVTFTAPMPLNVSPAQFRVTATLAGQSDSDTLLAAPKLMGLFASSSKAYGGQKIALSVRLAAPAPTGGVTVTLQSSSSSFKLANNTLTIPAGNQSGTVALSTPFVLSPITTTITANSSLGSSSIAVTVN